VNSSTYNALGAEAAVCREAFAPIADAGDALTPYDVFQRVGVLTRKLHDALRELGYHTEVENSLHALPDARARLDYVTTLTSQAAEKVLTAAEEGREIQQGVAADARSLSQAWSGAGAPDAALIGSTREFLAGVGQSTEQTNARFSDIMLAQDFHDLTGQTIQRVVKLATNLEEQLLKLLVETTPPEQRAKIETPSLAGPVVDAHLRDDVVTNQGQVDDLLESLGF
jgi:chemotaxis protein CheZ